MKKQLKATKVAICALITLSATVFSQDNTLPEGISTDSPNNVFQNLSGERVLEAIKPDRISYFSIFAGPSLNGSGDPVDEFGEVEENSINTWNQVSFQYQVTETKRFVLNPRFILNHNDPEARAFEVDDPVIGVAGRWFQFGKLSFGGGLNSIMPFARTPDTREDGLMFNPGGFNSLSYQATPKLSVGTWIWGRAFFYERSTEIRDERYAFFLSPQVNYDFSDNFGMSVFYQFDGEANNEYDIEMDTDQTLNLMTTITLNKYLTLQPMITLFQESSFQFESANFNMWLSGRFL